MDDLISRQKAIEALQEGRPVWIWKDGNDYQYGRASQWTSDIMTIECVPTVDAVEVVRCKDCRFFKGDGLECHWGMFAYEDDYCSNGEKVEADGGGHE